MNIELIFVTLGAVLGLIIGRRWGKSIAKEIQEEKKFYKTPNIMPTSDQQPITKQEYQQKEKQKKVKAIFQDLYDKQDKFVNFYSLSRYSNQEIRWHYKAVLEAVYNLAYNNKSSGRYRFKVYADKREYAAIKTLYISNAMKFILDHLPEDKIKIKVISENSKEPCIVVFDINLYFYI